MSKNNVSLGGMSAVSVKIEGVDNEVYRVRVYPTVGFCVWQQAKAPALVLIIGLMEWSCKPKRFRFCEHC